MERLTTLCSIIVAESQIAVTRTAAKAQWKKPYAQERPREAYRRPGGLSCVVPQARLDPLPDRDIGQALNTLFPSVSLYRRGKGAGAVIVGMDWSRSQPPLLTVEPRLGGCVNGAAP